MQPTSSYFICTAPRTGSFVLAEALEATGMAGRPREYFAPDHEQLWWDRLEVADDEDFLQKVLVHGTTSNGVFGVKLFWWHYEQLRTKLNKIRAGRADAYEPTDRIFPQLNHVFLFRRDIVRQAVSYHKALQTRVWWSIPNAPAVEQPEPRNQAQFDFDEIDRIVKLMLSHEASWHRYFDECGVKPLSVAYEDLVADYEGTVLEVLHHLRIPVPDPPEIKPPRLEKQADQESEEWVKRYHEMKRPGRTAERSARPPL